MHLLYKICSIPALSGFEHTGSEALLAIFKDYLSDCQIDPSGNVMGFLRCGKKDAPLIMLEAHYDTIGLVVSNILDGGFLTFASLGGFDPRILPSQEVIIHGKKDIYGVIGAKPPHILSAADRKKAVKLDDLTIDTGYSREELEKIVSVGCPITVKHKHMHLGEDKFSGSGLDNRAGVYAHLKAAQLLKEENLNADICVVAAHSEEIGRFGAKISADRLNPSLAVVVDVTHGDTPDGEKGRTCTLGKGPAVCLGPNLNRKYTSLLKKAIEDNKIDYQTEVEPGDTGTDAWDIQVSSFGIPCVLLSIPLRYMHTTVETLSLSDLESTSAAIAAFVKSCFGGDGNA